MGSIENGVYFFEASSSEAAKIAVEEDGAVLPLTIRLADIATADITVTLDIDPSVLEAYNKKNKTSYEALPEKYYSFQSNTITIKAGEVIAPQAFINVKTFTTGGKNYALPIVISDVRGSVAKTTTSSKFIYILDKPLIVHTPIMSGSGGMVKTGPFDEDGAPIAWGVNTLTWTLEGWVRMDGFSNNNQALFNSGSGDHEIYIRFGDSARPYNYLQIKTLGSQVDTEKFFEPNVWYHFALTYDGTNCNIYINGELKASFAPPSPKGGTVRFDMMEMISSGSYFRDNCNLSQVRLWKVALSQTQIQNNMFYELNASDERMMAYWKMDEGVGYDLADSTPNARHGIAATGCLSGWTELLRFDK